jgi:DNA (cytosine-5)-methyltransferase 1
MKVLNLYAGIGGNRKLWSGHQVTAVEIDPDIAEVYQAIYHDDTVVVGDALDYLEKHYAEYDFIWASPPCPSHGQYRHNVGVIGKGFDPIMPDMSLYSQIIFLKTYFKGQWVVENTKPYYKPLVDPSFILHRHLFWSSDTVPHMDFKPAKIRSKNKISDFDGYEVVAQSKVKNKRQVLRNCILPELGEYIMRHITRRCTGHDTAVPVS